MRILPAVVLFAVSPLADALADPFHHELREIREDVYVAFRPDINRVPVSGNITLIINRDDVVVIDSGVNPAAAENVIALLREKTSKPVTAVINTHWHDDHHLGNSAWKLHWPDAEIIAHQNTQKAIAGEPMAGLDTRAKGLEDYRKVLAERIEKGIGADGETLSPPELERSRTILATIPLLIEQAGKTNLVVPGRTYSDTLELKRPGRRIQLHYLGRGNTDGDTVVHLPDDGIVITGDLVVMPLPFGFYSYPADWITTLENLKSLQWTTLVPGHGEPQSDARYVDALIALLKEIRSQVAAGHAAGKSLEETRAGIDLGEMESTFTSGDTVLAKLFHAYWIMPITKSAWKELEGIEIVQGVEAT
ncbi:MAG: MBL fold metallo-hydrolase [Proteobacteria bacterium]|nr:MBL fold metallo-hydrolase [Pseudomonadota bacterium]